MVPVTASHIVMTRPIRRPEQRTPTPSQIACPNIRLFPQPPPPKRLQLSLRIS